MQRITHIRYSFLDLPKAITTSVFAFYNTSFTYVYGHGFDGSLRFSYVLCYFFLCCIWFFFEVVKYGYLFQSAV